MQQRNPSSSGAERRLQPVQATAFALRSIGQLCDMNIAAARVLLRTQARAASAFGWPDWSSVFEQIDERRRNVFAAGAEQLVQTTQRANDAAVDLQRQVGRVVQTQAVTIADNLQQGLEELSTQASESLQQLCNTAREQAQQAERTVQAMSQEFQETLRQGGEEARESLREAGDQARVSMEEGGRQARDAMQEGGQRARDLADDGEEQARDNGREVGHPASNGAKAHAHNAGGDSRSSAKSARR